MAIEAVFADLSRDLLRLREVVDELSITIPLEFQGPILVDTINDLVTRYQGELKQILSESSRAETLLVRTGDMGRVRRHLAESQRVFQDLYDAILQELLSFERLTELNEVGEVAKLAEPGSETREQWMRWTEAAKRGLSQLGPQLQLSSRAYLRCWMELAERGTGNSVSVRTTGQRISVTPKALEGLETGELT